MGGGGGAGSEIRSAYAAREDRAARTRSCRKRYLYTGNTSAAGQQRAENAQKTTYMSYNINTKFARPFEFDTNGAMNDGIKPDIPDEFTPDTVRDRWGEAVDAGFVPVPNMLLRAQAKLQLSPTTVIVLLNIMLHWWQRDRLPFPRSSAIAKRSGLGLRTVQRSIRDLEKKGLIARIRGNRKGPARYDLTGLREMLEQEAREDTWYRPGKIRNTSQDRRVGEAERPNLVT